MGQEQREDEVKFDFTTTGEDLGYIGLDQARILAIEHARDNTDFYPPDYADMQLVWEVVSAEESDDFYDIRLSFRPAGRFRGEPGAEQIIFNKMGELRVRQLLDEPLEPEGASSSPNSPVAANLVSELERAASSLDTQVAEMQAMCERFKNAEEGYEAWLDTHSEGWVFNNFGGQDSAFNVLHRAPCSFLRRPVDEGRRTIIEKICCDDRDYLIGTINVERGGPDRWKECGFCLRKFRPDG